MEQIDFELELLEEARDFLKSLTKEVRGKIGRNIRRVQKGERGPELFKKLDRDTNTLVVATHGIIKKTQKTPAKEISKAEDIRKKYFENKNNE